MASAFARERNKLIAGGAMLAAAIVILYYQFSGGSGGLPDTINFVCVATGKTYKIDRDKAVKLPLVNPDTGEATLLPYAEQDGRRFISRRRAVFLDQLAGVNKYVDPKTLEVRSAP